MNQNGSATALLITWTPPELLGLSALRSTVPCPAHAMLLTVGAGSTELGETFSDPVEAALPARTWRAGKSRAAISR